MSPESEYQFKQYATGNIAARLASDVGNPLIIPSVVFGFTAFSLPLPDLEFGLLVSVSTGFFSVIPITVALVLVKLLPVESRDFPERTSRIGLYVSTILSFTAGSMIILNLSEEPLIRLLTVVCIGNLIFGFLINFKWKISAHCAAVAAGGVFLLLTGLAGSPGNLPVITSGLFLLCLLLPLVHWARYRIGIHSAAELYWGSAMGFSVTAVIYILWYFLYIG